MEIVGKGYADLIMTANGWCTARRGDKLEQVQRVVKISPIYTEPQYCLEYADTIGKFEYHPFAMDPEVIWEASDHAAA